MEFPIEIQRLINEYAKPITRPDWREGSYIKRSLPNFDEQGHLIIIDGSPQYFHFEEMIQFRAHNIYVIYKLRYRQNSSNPKYF